MRYLQYFAIALSVLAAADVPARWSEVFTPSPFSPVVTGVAADAQSVAVLTDCNDFGSRIAILADDAWTEVATLPRPNKVGYIKYAGGVLYVAGRSLAATPAGVCAQIAAWDGHEWSDLAGGITGTLSNVVVFDDQIVVTGDITRVGDLPVSNIAIWNGASWSALGDSLPAQPTAVWADEQGLLAALPANYGGNGEGPVIWQWDGSDWSSPWPQLPGQVCVIARIGETVFAEDVNYGYRLVDGQWFDLQRYWWDFPTRYVHHAGQLFRILRGSYPETGDTFDQLEYWDNTTWQRVLGAETLKDLTSSSQGLLVGGEFTQVGSALIHNLLCYTGSAINAFPDDSTGPASRVSAIGARGSQLLMGSVEQQFVGGSPVSTAAWYAADSWSDIQECSSGSMIVDVYVDAAHYGFAPYGNWYYGDGVLHCGRAVRPIRNAAMTYYNGQWVRATYDAWDCCSTATPLGERFDDFVYELAVCNGELYAVGAFENCGTVNCPLIARWDGASWVAVGEPIDAGSYSWLTGICYYDGALYVGGPFYSGDGHGGEQVAKLVDGHWERVGGAFVGPIKDLIVHQDRLVVGGEFTTIGGDLANRVAVWDGVAWTTVGGGINGSVSCLASNEQGLWVGGFFNTTGDGTPSGNLALWQGDLVAVTVRDYAAGWREGAAVVSWSLGVPLAVDESLRIERDRTGAAQQVVWTSAAGAAANDFAVMDAEGRPGDVYRLVSQRLGAEPQVVAEATLPARTPLARGPSLLPPMPNPANPVTRIDFELSQPGWAEITVFDLRGRLVRALAAYNFGAGRHQTRWDGIAADGRPAASGTYVVRLNTGDAVRTVKLELVR